MTIIVQKFGGTSVADLEKIRRVAEIVTNTATKGIKVVVVVSAMAGETDKLVNLYKQVSSNPSAREVDVLLSTGEQITVSLLAMLLNNLGFPAKSYCGFQVPVKTDNNFNNARIKSINTSKILKDLAANKIVVVAGFQGVDSEGNITTLGRGGSDTTAVALSAALKASECQIYTDVAGVFSADPRIIQNPSKLEKLSCQEMLELSSLGAKVLQTSAVEYATHHNVNVRVLSTFDLNDSGTYLTQDIELSSVKPITAIASSINHVMIQIDLPESASQTQKIISEIYDCDIQTILFNHIMINDMNRVIFVINKKDLLKIDALLNRLPKGSQLIVDDNIGILSIVGNGLQSNPAIKKTAFKILSNEEIEIKLISSSEIKVCLVLDEKNLKRAAEQLHTAFELDMIMLDKTSKGDFDQTLVG